ncbi:MAG: hypothetical protein ACC654_09325 [Acidimicrobiia bacterium]
MRRSFTTLAVAALLIGLVAAPAVADEPDEFVESFSFEEINPCSGELITINIDAFTSVHDHDGTLIARLKRTGTTSDGYIMGHGRESFVEAGSTITASFNDPWVNPGLGTKFVASGRFLMVDGDILVDDFRLACTS